MYMNNCMNIFIGNLKFHTNVYLFIIDVLSNKFDSTLGILHCATMFHYKLFILPFF